MTSIDFEVLSQVEKVAKHAGKEIQKCFNKTGMNIQYKQDAQPVTVTGLNAHKILVAGLKSVKDLKILSEEDNKSYDFENEGMCWVIDSLDWTKEFIKVIP